MKTTKTYSKECLSNDRDKFLKRIARDTVVSFKLEGIIISLEEAYKMAKEADSNLQKEKKLA